MSSTQLPKDQVNTWASLEEGVGSQDQESATEQNHKRSLSAWIHSPFEHLSSEPPQNLQEQKGLPLALF